MTLDIRQVLTPEKWRNIMENCGDNHKKLISNNSLNKHEQKFFSQNGEDGVIQEIFKRIGTLNKFFVEFGARDGIDLSNTAYLRLIQEWKGLLLDCVTNDTPEINLFKEHLTASNINTIFKKYKVPYEFDLLSIDVDGIDWYLWQALDYQPRVVIIEYNSCLPNDIPLAMEYDAGHYLNPEIHGSYYGANLMAFNRLAEKKGYQFVTTVLWNAIFIKKEDFSKLGIENVPEQDIYNNYFCPENFWYFLIPKIRKPFICIESIPRRPFEKYKTDILVESGSFYGDGIQNALNVGFKKIYSYEVAENLYNFCKGRYLNDSRVKLFLKSSTRMARDLLEINEKITFWLDGHYSYGETSFETKVCPIIEELEQIKMLPRKDHFILIDDVRLFGTSEFMFITLDEVKAKILEINPLYNFKFEYGHIPNDILVAYIDPVIESYNSFQNTCRLACINNNIEKNFRRQEIVLNMLDFFDMKFIDHYGQILDKLLSKYNISMEILSLLDKWGNPFIVEWRNYKLSPCCFRYWMFGLLICEYRSLNNILEIGAGFGGQGFVLSKLKQLGYINYNSYTIIDLPGTLDLQKKFLGSDFQFIENSKVDNNIKYDLVLANYSLAEFPEAIQKNYIPILENANHAIIAWNSNSPVLPFMNKASKILDDVMGYKIYLW